MLKYICQGLGFMGKEYSVVYQVGDQVLYGIPGVCRILELEVRSVDRKKVEYYVLEPLEQPGARFYVPTQNQAAVAKLRKMMDAAQINALLASDAVRADAWIADENQRKLRYRSLINGGDRAALLCMVRTLHRHKQEQTAAGRKFHLCDENFLHDAEKLLSAEFSLALQIQPGEVGTYIKNAMGIE